MERRDITQRAELVRWVVDEIVHNPGVQLSSARLAEWLHVSADVADRILQRLQHAGLVREVSQGVWTRVPE